MAVSGPSLRCMYYPIVRPRIALFKIYKRPGWFDRSLGSHLSYCDIESRNVSFIGAGRLDLSAWGFHEKKPNSILIPQQRHTYMYVYIKQPGKKMTFSPIFRDRMVTRWQFDQANVLVSLDVNVACKSCVQREGDTLLRWWNLSRQFCHRPCQINHSFSNTQRTGRWRSHICEGTATTLCCVRQPAQPFSWLRHFLIQLACQECQAHTTAEQRFRGLRQLDYITNTAAPNSSVCG
jgi:hypothetical protein